ncbi:unnamed protein product [Schistocephalus solidus]|uniref:SEC7 domain-containing protein n=1 Tax=Schistocephalus solidus TaxID=70667 RepID=A0A183TNX9_SCHSO|nr:unnamed protein product [Schistocephalus solidus]
MIRPVRTAHPRVEEIRGRSETNFLVRISNEADDDDEEEEELVVVVEETVDPKNIRSSVPGIGHVTECRLQAFGVHTIQDLFTHRGVLYHLVSPTSLRYFMRIVLGHSEDDWVTGADRVGTGDASTRSTGQKSMSVER